MSWSKVVDEEYRLRVHHLRGQRAQVNIINVSFQGLEDLHAVLHFREFSRWLILDAQQAQQLVAITGSPFSTDWIGHTIAIQPQSPAEAMRDSQSTISLLPDTPTDSQQQLPWRTLLDTMLDSPLVRENLTVVFTLLLIFIVAVVLNRNPALWDFIAQWF